ncbi:MAG: hypothetical protein IPP72_04015 [Chitinophagaceae bacterium]|nr:hypothetical protein [Chitinophagaceae bacterium]
MKYIFTAMMVLTACFAKGQIVNIPDVNFNNALVAAGVDTNGDGLIQVSEAEAITNLTLPGFSNNLITDFTGIKSFVNMTQFTMMSINTNAILDVSNLINLETLTVDNTGISSLLVNGCSGLKNIYLGQNGITTLDVSSTSNLEVLRCSYNTSLGSLILGNIHKLKSLDCSHTALTNIDLTQCDSLLLFYFDGNHMQTVNISGLKKIETLSAVEPNSIIDYLYAAGCTSLKSIKILYTSGIYEFLDIAGCINLEEINIQEAGFINPLDLSFCQNLKKLTLTHTRVPSINLKNGSLLSTFVLEAYQADNNLRVTNICADDFEIDSLRRAMENNHSGYPTPVNINSYCSFFPAGAYNTIKGKTSLDLNNNGCSNTTAAMPGVAMKITDTSGNSLIRYTAPSGDYRHYPYKGVFTLTPYFPSPYFTINPASANVTFDTANSITEVRDFCIEPNGVHNDLEITFLPAWPPARPGFDAGYTLVYKNRGTTTLSGNVQLNFDNNKMNFVSASENVTAQSSGQLTWNYNNLQPFESKTINVRFNLLPPPVNNIGDTITYLATITPTINDETAFDNSFILPQRLIGSFDPNDKQCLEGSQLDISKISDYLHYQIHFQNEGTDTAFNVVVADTLSDKLDWNSFELIGSSHPVDVKLTNNKAEFIFQNIKLPYKAIDEPGSNGYVAFKIKPKPSVVIGDSLNNKAAIYFDFNLPVITNTATTIVSSSSTPVPVKLEYFSINTRNNSNILNWKAACSNGNATFIIQRSEDGIHFSSIGNINVASIRCQLPFNFTDNNPVAGKNYYRLKITDAEGVSFYSKTLVVGNDKSSLQITAVANNTVYFSSNKQQTIQLKVIAADGKEVLVQKQTVAAGNNNISLSMKNTSKGIYTMIIYTEEGETITQGDF